MADLLTFQLADAPTFEAPVELPVPGSDVPGVIVVEFHARGAAWDRQTFGPNATLPDRELLLQLVKGWRGPDMPFGPEAVDKLLDRYPGGARAIVLTYRAEFWKERAKNSEARPATP